MRSKTMWILFAILVVVAAYFFLFEERERVKKEAESKVSRRLLAYTREEVRRIVFVNPEGDRIEMLKEGEDWRIVSPVQTKGSKPTIDALLQQLVPGSKQEVIENAENFGDFGLDEPFAVLILSLEDGSKPDTILVGDKTPAGPSCYVRLGSSKSVIVSREMTHNIMNKNLYHLRDKNFLAFEGITVDSMIVHRGGESIRLRREKEAWFVTEPHVRASRPEIEPWLNEFSRAIIREFAREDTEELSEYGLETADREITLYRSVDTVRATFGDGKDDLVYVARSGLDKVILLKAEFLDVFDWTVEKLRMMNVTFVPTGDIKTIGYETPDTSLSLRAWKGSWITTDVDSAEIRFMEVSEFLRKLSNAKYESILAEPLTESDPRLEPFLVKIELKDFAGILLDRITIAAPYDEYEVGASLTTNALGRLEKGTFKELEHIFNRFGVLTPPE